MDKENYISFMALHTYPIVENLAKIQNVTKKEALDLLYSSDFYGIYERENTKLWHFSSVTLTDLLNQEISTGHIEFPVEG